MDESVKEIDTPDFRPHVIGRYLKPIAEVGSGDTIMVHTRDAFDGMITSENDNLDELVGKPLNPLTGPIYIKGASPGDTLKVKIEGVEPSRNWAVSALIPYFGGLTSTNLTRTLQDPLPKKIWIYRRKTDGTYSYTDRFAIKESPFIGTIGTAPEIEALSSLTPHAHGGNMDCPDVKPGNTIYLPVNVPGAYLYLGDCHAAQGEGEACGVALEISARVTLNLSLIKRKSISWPRIESDREIMTTGSARPLEDASRIALYEMVKWLETEHSYDRWDAYQLVSQAAKLYIANLVDTYYTVVAKISKEFL